MSFWDSFIGFVADATPDVLINTVGGEGAADTVQSVAQYIPDDATLTGAMASSAVKAGSVAAVGSTPLGRRLMLAAVGQAQDEGAASDIGGALGTAGKKTLTGAGIAGEAYSKVVSQPLSTFFLMAGNKALAANPAEAWRQAENVSPGQGFVSAVGGNLVNKGLAQQKLEQGVLKKYSTELDNMEGGGLTQAAYDHTRFLFPGFDVTDPEQREAAFEDQGVGRVASLAADTYISWMADPFVIGGKMVKAGRTASLARSPGSTKYQQQALTELSEYEAWKAGGGAGKAPNGWGQMVEETLTMNEAQARNYLGKFSLTQDKELAAAIVGHTDDPATMSAAFRVWLGDARALDTLKSNRADLAEIIERNRDVRADLFQRYSQADPDADSSALAWLDDQDKIDELDAVYESMSRQDNFLSAVERSQASMLGAKEGGAARWAWVEKRRAESARASAGRDFGGYGYDVIQPSRFHRPVVYVRQKAHDMWRDTPAFFVPTKGVPSSNSSNEMVAALRQAKFYDSPAWHGDAALRRQQLNDIYMRAYLDEAPDVARARAVEQIEDIVVQDMLDVHKIKMTREQLAEVMTMYRAKRQQLIDHVSQKGYWLGDDGETLMKSPLLDTQIANGVPVMDFKAMEKALLDYNRTGGIPPGASFAQGAGHVWYNLEQVWRPSVLLRIGYPIRNVGESSLRAMSFLGTTDGLWDNVGTATKNLAKNRVRGTKRRRLVDYRVQKQMYREGWRGQKGRSIPTVSDYVAHEWRKLSADNELIKMADKGIKDIDDDVARLQKQLDREMRAPLAAHWDDINALRQRIVEAQERQDNLYRVIEESNERMRVALEKPGRLAEKDAELSIMDRLNQGETEFAEMALPDAFNPNLPINTGARENLSSATSWEATTRGAGEVDANLLAHADLGSDIVSPGDPTFWVDAADTLNRRVGNSPVMRKWILRENGETDDQVARWLVRSTDDEAKRWRSFLSVTDEEQAVKALEEAEARIQHSFNYDDELIRMSFSGKEFTPADLRLRWAGKTDLNPIAGRAIATMTGNAKMMAAYKSLVDKAFHKIGVLPEDRLIREPFYVARFNEHRGQALRALYGEKMAQGYVPTTGDISALYSSAHKRALTDLKRNIFTIERYSNFSHVLERVAPFTQAWENGIRTWPRLVKNDPSILARMTLIWNAPQRAGMVVVDSETGEPVEAGRPMSGDQMIIFEGVPGLDKLGLGNVKVSKNSLNIIFPGENWYSPSAGPVIGIAASEYTKNAPKWGTPQMPAWVQDRLLPFGPSKYKGSVDMAMGGWANRIREFVGGDDNYSFAQMKTKIMKTEVTKYDLGLRDTYPTMDEIDDKTAAMQGIRILSSFTLPFSVQFDSEFSQYRSEFIRLQEEHGIEADQIFYDMYGDEFAQWTVSSSSSNAGVAPTREAQKNFTENQDLISNIMKVTGNNPEFIAMVTNTEDSYSDPFDSGVWAWQLSQQVAPGVNENLREMPGAAEAVGKGYESQGWHRYMQLSADIMASAQARGITSLSDPNVADLVAVRTAWVNQQAKENPYWYASFKERNDAQALQGTMALQTILADEKFMGARGDEPTWTVARDYMSARTDVYNMLQARKAAGGSNNITAASNDDVEAVWGSITASMASQDETFAMFYVRYLEGDDLMTPVTP